MARDMGMTACLVANGAASAETRQEFAAAQMRGADSRGGLLGRLAGVKKGGVIKANDGQGNAGSAEFQAMVMDNIHQSDVDYWVSQGAQIGSGKESW